MSTNASGIGLSRKQRAFAVLEDTFGTLQFPVGTTDFIFSVGNGIINQNPAFSDSEEVSDTLDLIDRFQNAIPAATWSLPMYLRPSGTIGGVPQGAALFHSLQGSINAATTAAIVADPGLTDVSIVIDTIAGGTLPEVGTVSLAGTGTETVHYTGITRTSRTATSATLTGCTRAYDGTTAATHAIDQVVTLNSIFYKQTTESPSFSIWIESDHFVQGVQGASADGCDIEVSSEGAVTFTFSGQAMKMFYAGSTTVATSSLATNTHIHVTDASLFTVGAYVWNSTQGVGVSSHASIATVDETNNILYLSGSLGVISALSDTIRGYLPPGTTIGDPIESKDTTVLVNGVSTLMKGTTISIKTPKQYLVDEIGTDYAEDFLEDRRDITGSLKLYFRKADAKYFTEGLANTEVPILLTFGDTASEKVEIYLKKNKMETPTVEYATPAVELTIPFKSLGTVGEDSCEIVLT